MTAWGDRLIAGIATLAAIAVIGAALVVLTSFFDPSRDGPTSYGLALLWAIGLSAMYSPIVAWPGVVLLILSTPWLERRPKLVFPLAGLFMALALIPTMAGAWEDQAIRLAIGAAYGETFRRMLAFQFRTYFDRNNSG